MRPTLPPLRPDVGWDGFGGQEFRPAGLDLVFRTRRPLGPGDWVRSDDFYDIPRRLKPSRPPRGRAA
jgi:hypothetical protein